MSQARWAILATLSALLAGAGTIIWTAPDWLVDTVAQQHPGCIYRVATLKPVLALTLDDGPDPGSTPSILRELRKHGARATFFLISGRVRNRERLVEKMVAEGHELGNHFSQDIAGIRQSPSDFEADLLRAHRTLTALDSVIWARPASGWYNQSMVEIMSRHGYRCALGSVYPLDAAIPSVYWASSYILKNARPGAIVVLHDGGGRGRRTARVLARVLPELRVRGYRVVSLSELVAAGSR